MITIVTTDKLEISIYTGPPYLVDLLLDSVAPFIEITAPTVTYDLELSSTTSPIEVSIPAVTYNLEVATISGAGSIPFFTTTAIAGSNLSGHRVVAITNDIALYASNNDQALLSKQIGLTLHAAMSGREVSVLLLGRLTEPSWNFDPNKAIFLGSFGMLTQTIPSSEWICYIGYPINKNTIFFNPKILLYKEA